MWIRGSKPLFERWLCHFFMGGRRRFEREYNGASRSVGCYSRRVGYDSLYVGCYSLYVGCYILYVCCYSPYV